MTARILKSIKRFGRDNSGFTLVELMAVLAVLAVIAAIAVPRFTGTINNAKTKADKTTAEIIARAAEQKWIDDGESGAKGYTATQLANNGYLKEKPSPQDTASAGEVDDFVAKIGSDGTCTGVYYGTDPDMDTTDKDNLLNETQEEGS